MIIYLARHGQTTGDIENRYGGDYEDYLTNFGKEQSLALAEQLALKHAQDSTPARKYGHRRLL